MNRFKGKNLALVANLPGNKRDQAFYSSTSCSLKLLEQNKVKGGSEEEEDGMKKQNESQWRNKRNIILRE